MRRLRLPIAEPCHEDWDAMDGGTRERHCAQCATSVHHLSEMTEDEAQVFLAERKGTNVCVRYRANPDGSIRFRARSKAQQVARASMMAVGLAACTQPREEVPMMGAVAVESQPCATPRNVVEAPPPPEVEPIDMMGEIAIEPPEPEPELVPVPEPKAEMMGKIAAPVPAPAPEPMGRVVAPAPELNPAAEPEGIEMMGDVAIHDDRQ